jgi:hypothetical protein
MAFLSTLTVISWKDDTIIPRIAFSTETFLDDIHDQYADNILEITSYMRPTHIILVRRDVCCGDGGEHKRIVDMAEGRDTRRQGYSEESQVTV